MSRRRKVVRWCARAAGVLLVGVVISFVVAAWVGWRGIAGHRYVKVSVPTDVYVGYISLPVEPETRVHSLKVGPAAVHAIVSRGAGWQLMTWFQMSESEEAMAQTARAHALYSCSDNPLRTVGTAPDSRLTSPMMGVSPEWTAARGKVAREEVRPVRWSDPEEVPRESTLWDEAAWNAPGAAFAGAGAEDSAFGWPCVAFRMWKSWQGPMGKPVVSVGGGWVPTAMWGVPGVPRKVAWHPMFPGLLVDAVVWGVAACVVVGGVRWVVVRSVRGVRRWRGLCGGCGYERRGLGVGAVCPECGGGGADAVSG